MKFDQTAISSYIKEAMPTAITADQVALIKAQVEKVHEHLDDVYENHQRQLENQFILESLNTQLLQDKEKERHYQETFLPSVKDLDKDYEIQEKESNRFFDLIWSKKRALDNIRIDRFSSATSSLIGGLANQGRGINHEDVTMVVNLGEAPQQSARELKLRQEIAELEAQYQPLREKLLELAGLRGKRDREIELHTERLERIENIDRKLKWLDKWYETNKNVYIVAKEDLTPDKRQALEARLQAEHSKQEENIPLFSKFAITQAWLESSQSLDMKKTLLALQKEYKLESLKLELEVVQRLVDSSIEKTDSAECDIDRLNQELGFLPAERSIIDGRKIWTSWLHILESGVNYLWWAALSATVVLAGVTLAAPTLTLAAATLAATTSVFVTLGLWTMIHSVRYNRQQREEASERELDGQFRSLEAERQGLISEKAEYQQKAIESQAKYAELMVELAELDDKYQQLEQAFVISPSVSAIMSDDSAMQSCQSLGNISFFSCCSDKDISDLEQTTALAPQK